MPQIRAPFHIKTKAFEIIFTHTNRFGEEYHSFVNGQYTTDGGTHLTAFKEALTKAANDYDPKKRFDGDDIRDGLADAVSLSIMNPVFEGQTKIKFVMNDIRPTRPTRLEVDFEARNHIRHAIHGERIRLHPKDSPIWTARFALVLPLTRDCPGWTGPSPAVGDAKSIAGYGRVNGLGDTPLPRERFRTGLWGARKDLHCCVSSRLGVQNGGL